MYNTFKFLFTSVVSRSEFWGTRKSFLFTSKIFYTTKLGNKTRMTATFTSMFTLPTIFVTSTSIFSYTTITPLKILMISGTSLRFTSCTISLKFSWYILRTKIAATLPWKVSIIFSKTRFIIEFRFILPRNLNRD